MTSENPLARLAGQVLKESPEWVERVRPMVPPSRLSIVNGNASFGNMFLDLFRRRPRTTAAERRARRMPRLVVLAVSQSRVALFEERGDAANVVYEERRSKVQIALKDGDPYGFSLMCGGEIVVQLQLAELESKAVERLRLIAGPTRG